MTNKTTFVSNLTTEIQVGVIGYVLEFKIMDGNKLMDIHDATVKTIKLQKPDNSIVSLVASFGTDGTDGVIKYATLITDFNLAGTYHAQAYVETPSIKGYSIIFDFSVGANIS